MSVRRLVIGRPDGPAHGVRDHAPNLGLEIRRTGLVPRAEVEDPAAAPLEAAAAPEHRAALEPAHEDEPVGGRDVEVLAVHLLVLDRERIAEAFGGRVGRVWSKSSAAAA